jgi:hypothetical protein
MIMAPPLPPEPDLLLFLRPKTSNIILIATVSKPIESLAVPVQSQYSKDLPPYEQVNC